MKKYRNYADLMGEENLNDDQLRLDFSFFFFEDVIDRVEDIQGYKMYHTLFDLGYYPGAPEIDKDGPIYIEEIYDLFNGINEPASFEKEYDRLAEDCCKRIFERNHNLVMYYTITNWILYHFRPAIAQRSLPKKYWKEIEDIAAINSFFFDWSYAKNIDYVDYISYLTHSKLL